MNADVVIGAMNLLMRGVPPVDSGDRFARAVLGSLESALEDDRSIDRDALILIPRIDLHLTVKVGSDGSIPDAIARALAHRLAEAAALAGRGAPRDRGAWDRESTAEAELLVEVARRVGAGELGDGARILGALGRLDAAQGQLAPTKEDLVRAMVERPFAILSRLARRGLDLLVLGRATEAERREILAAVRAALGAIEAPNERGGSEPALWVDALKRARASAESLAVELPASLELCLAIAQSVRLTPRLVLGSRSASRAIAVAIDRWSQAIEDTEGTASAPTTADATGVAARDTLGRTWAQPKSGSTPEVTPTESTLHQTVAAEPRDEPLHVEVGDDPVFIDTDLGGLVFAFVPLAAGGFDEALVSEAEVRLLIRYEVLRRFVEQELGMVHANDPAISLLSGLSAEPTREELSAERQAWKKADLERVGAPVGGASTVEDLIDGWAARIREDLVHWLAWPQGESLRPVLETRARIWIFYDRYELELPYTEHYVALLQAGLLVDWRFVAWLDHRDLRLVFREGRREES